MRYFCRVVLLLVVSLTLSCHGRNAYDHAPTEAFLRSIKQKLYPGMRTTGHYCTWEGVSCPGNQEVHVKLTDGVLEGDLNSLFPFPQGAAFVIEVDFSNNRNLYGSYPPEFGTDLENLWYLSLRNTGLYGQIPDEWDGMYSLYSVYLDGSRACGTLPKWTRSSMTMHDISFANLGLQGDLGGESWTELKALRNVNLEGNKFCSGAPASWKSIQWLNDAVIKSGNGYTPTSSCSPVRCPPREKKDGATMTRPTAVLPFAIFIFIVSFTL